MAGDASLQLLLDSFVAIASERDVDAILEQAVDLARLSTRAKYGAAVAVEADAISAFVHKGMTTSQVAALPHPPYGQGMLGAVLEDKAPIRLDVLQDDTRSVGFPLGHVPMTAFLGVPIMFDDHLLGALYLTKPPGHGDFTDEDELFMGVLARQTGAALASARVLLEREQELGERRRAEMLVRLLQEVSMAANQATTVEEALRASIDEVCSSTHWPVGHVYLPDDDGNLASTTIWHIDDPERFKNFRRITEATPLRAGIGLPGRVLAAKRPAWISDVTDDDNFPRAKAAEDIGVRGAFAFPVLLGGEVVAVLEFFSTRPEPPDDAMLEVTAILGAQVGRVAERQRASEQLEEANAELRRTDAMKSDFVSMASHELRTPLTAILGFASTLRAYWDSTPEDEKLQSVDVIDRQARRLSRLVNDLLAMSRIEAGKVEVRATRLDIVEVVRTAVASMGKPAADLEVRADTSGGPLAVEADPDHVEQILLNYLSNALKYGEPPVCIEVGPSDDGAFVVVCVRDEGPGVPEKFRSRLFEKFSQASTGAARSATGTGLGLSIARGLAQANGGDTWYEPNQPAGAAFCLRLREAAD
jgi:signal transduction histidine kinase